MFPAPPPGRAAPPVCPNDGTPLAFEVAGRRWKLEAFLGHRPGGGIFIAYHLITGVRAAVSLIYDAREPEQEERINREVQAQRLLEPHPNLFKLLELGSERDGTRFLVSELHAEQSLSEVLREWSRPTDGARLFSQAAMILRPLLGLLATAHRLGIAHGELNAGQVYVTATDADIAGDMQLAGPRLYGLRRITAGPALVEAVRGDLSALGTLLYQILAGEVVNKPLTPAQQTALAQRVGQPVAHFVLRTLAMALPTGEAPFSTVEELRLALVRLQGETSGDGIAPASDACELVDPATERTAPTAAPSRMSGARRRPSRSRDNLPLAASPLPDVALTNPLPPQKSGFSMELRQISFAELLGSPPQVDSDEVVARGRHQLSIPNRPSPISPIAAAAAQLQEDLEVELVMTASAPSPQPSPQPPPEPLAALPEPSEEPTRDLRTQIRPGSFDLSNEPTQVPAAPARAQAGKFKLWGWWKR